MWSRRSIFWRMRCLILILACLFHLPADARASDALLGRLAGEPMVLVMRHEATEPGTGDPPGFRLGDCSTQRNLSQAGRQAAAATGRALRSAGLRTAEVRTSPWCRTEETARRLGFGDPRPEASLGSFFGDRRSEGAAATAELRRIASEWRGPGALILVTHQVNITAATGVYPAPGEIVVLRPGEGSFTVLGRLRL